MDASIFRDRAGTADERVAEQITHAHISQVRKFGGAAVLDWHLEQLNPARLHGAGPVLGGALAELADDGDVYWATPQEVADWWQTRRERIEASTGLSESLRNQNPRLGRGFRSGRSWIRTRDLRLIRAAL